jgi:Zn-dependent peptidase ImmA (M78 family)/transcriptional regulator with XRE-family HTH domain
MENVLQELDPRVLGGRLQEARKSAGLTQQQVADDLRIARTTVVAIEKGERRVSAHELIAFAKRYCRSVSDFVSRRIVTESFVPQFRATQEYDEATEQVGLELQTRAEDFAELEKITVMPVPRVYPPPYETTGASPEQVAEDIANLERGRLGMGDGPIPDLRDRLASQVGVRIFYFPMPSKIAGVFAYNESLGACIGINVNHPPDRRNWSLAHEYGHFLMTRYQADVTVLFTKQRQSAKERMTDSFAEYFLMPSTGLNRRITELQRSLPSGISLAHVCDLANTYGVSVQALIRRLESLKRLPYGTWERLKAEGFKVRKAQEMLGLAPNVAPADAMPRQYVTMAVYAFNKGILSEGELARYLRVDRLRAREEVERLSDPIHSEEEEFAHYSSDLGKHLTGS